MILADGVAMAAVVRRFAAAGGAVRRTDASVTRRANWAKDHYRMRFLYLTNRLVHAHCQRDDPNYLHY